MEYLEYVLGGLLAAHGLAQFIVNLTDTPWDDKAVGKLYKIVELLAGVTDRAKTLPGETKDRVKIAKEDG
jgi:ABC-type phosphate/phosphonate transport system ATPase subunit